jgi:hypothetical protein
MQIVYASATVSGRHPAFPQQQIYGNRCAAVSPLIKEPEMPAPQRFLNRAIRQVGVCCVEVTT